MINHLQDCGWVRLKREEGKMELYKQCQKYLIIGALSIVGMVGSSIMVLDAGADKNYQKFGEALQLGLPSLAVGFICMKKLKKLEDKID